MPRMLVAGLLALVAVSGPGPTAAASPPAAARAALKQLQVAGWRATWDTDGRLRTLSGGRTTPHTGDMGEAARTFVTAQGGLFGVTSGDTLRIEAIAESPVGQHVLLEQRHDGVPVVGGRIRIHFDRGGRIFLAHGAAVPDAGVSTIPTRSTADAVAIAERAFRSDVGLGDGAPIRVEEADLAILPRRRRGVLVHRVGLHSDDPLAVREYLVGDRSGRVLRRRSVLKYVVDGTGRIFDPNAVNVLNDTTLTDMNDADYPALAPAYSNVTLRQLDDAVAGLFSLTGPWVKIVDINPPNDAPPKLANKDAFLFPRSDRRFEGVMCYAHIDRNQRYIQSLGFNTTNNRQTPVDPHSGTSDNSFYRPLPAAGNGYLAFGDGTVDDAEDADVILHEYGHAIQDHQHPGGYDGSNDCDTETEAQGEGFGDYWATSNTFAESVAHGFDPACLFEWSDDPTGACGRRVDGTKRWIRDRSGECHDDGEIWSAALYDLFQALGKQTTDELVLQSHFLVAANPSFNEGSCALLDADLLLNFGINETVLEDTLRARGVLVRCTSGPCTFDLDGDGDTDFDIEDTDGNGFCEWPEGKTHLHGTLVFTPDTPVEFTGTTIVEADRIIVEEHARLVGQPDQLRALTIYATGGDFLSGGIIELSTSDDLTLRAQGGQLSLRGEPYLRAADQLRLIAKPGNLTLVPDAPDPSRFNVFARTRVELTATGANGSLFIDNARVAGRAVSLITRANVSVVGPKVLDIGPDAEVSTVPKTTGIQQATADLVLDATGRIVAHGALLAAGRNLRFQTSRAGDHLCLSNGSALETEGLLGRRGRIYLTGVRGQTFDDGTTTFLGQVLGAVTPGACP